MRTGITGAALRAKAKAATGGPAAWIAGSVSRSAEREQVVGEPGGIRTHDQGSKAARL